MVKYRHILKLEEAAVYIDPNTGGIIFQALAAAFVAISGVLLVFSGRIRAYLSQLRRKARKDDSEEQD